MADMILVISPYKKRQVLGGYLAARFGGKIVIASTVISSSLLTLISPVAATTNVHIFFGVRVALGFVQVCQYISFNIFHIPDVAQVIFFIL
uniref:Major facilitator superfamily (MFS) profile domain-containing protein n=1 Tax=Parascaris equorum TaxID=6256 RepID=A0A914RY55_PAREQ